MPRGLEQELKDVLESSGRDGFRNAVFAKLGEDPSLLGVAPGLLYRTLGTTLPDGMQNAAVLWAICHQFAVANERAVLATG